MANYDQYPEIINTYERLQTVVKLRELVRRIWKVDAEFATPSGKILDGERGKASLSRNQFCHKCLLDKSGLRKCDQSVRDIVHAQQSGKTPADSLFGECHAGFRYLAVPVVHDGKFVGSVLAGGFLTELPTPAKKKEVAEKTRAFLGAEVADVEAAWRDVPVLSERERGSLKELIEFGIQEVRDFHVERMRREGEIRTRLMTPSNAYASTVAIVGRSRAMERVFELLSKLKDSESAVLIQGENGTGKEIVAQAIHRNSARRDRPFVMQNCSALNDNLLDSELFGHVRGSFTGAIRDKKGLFEAANGGTFFMDEIAEMSPSLQVKLLRVLQEGVFTPVGSTEPRRVDVRIVAATNRDLKEMVETGKFREDLFYRINVITIRVPPLRERREDIPLLVEHFLQKHASRTSREMKTIAPKALDVLLSYNWPGNVRQLENEIQRAIVLSGSSHVIGDDVLSPVLMAGTQSTVHVKLQGKLRDAMEQVERHILQDGLRRNGWNKSKLSRELGISRATLIWKVQKYGLVEEAQG